MFCKFCGAEIADNSKFCAYCGTNNEIADAPAVQQEPTPFTPAQQIDNPTTILDNAPAYTPIQQPNPVAQPTQIYTPPVNPIPQPIPEAQAGYTPTQPSVIYDEKSFFEAFASKNTKSNYKWTMIISFITAGFSLVALCLGNVVAIVDIIVYLVLGILLLKKKKWTLPLGVAIYGGIGTLASLGLSGTPSGIVALVISILATISAKKVEAAYKEYKATGVLPTQPIGK